jgi:hypothetical protein
LVTNSTNPIENAKVKAPVIAQEIRMVSRVPISLQLMVLRRLLLTLSSTFPDGLVVFNWGFKTLFIITLKNLSNSLTVFSLRLDLSH